MGFSAFAGLMGGMGKSAEQVLDRNLTRLDAAGVAQEKEAAQMRLDDRVNQYKQEAVQLGYKRDDFTHDRGLMDVKNQTADALKAKLAEETRTQDPAYIAKVIAGKNQEHSGLTTGQESTAKNKSEINAHDAEAEYDRAHAKKALAEIGNGGAKPLTEPELAARVETGDKSLRILYNIGTDPVTGQFTGKAEDIDGYIKAKPHLERAVRNQESLPAAFVDQISDHRKAGTSLAKTKEESDTKTGVANINQGKSWYQSNISPEEFKKLPKEEQYKAINQSKAPAPSDPKAATGAPVARTPFKEQALESGSGLPSAGATTTPKTENPLVSQIPDGKGAKVTKESHPEGWEGDYTKPDGTTIRVRATKTGFVPIEPAKQKG